MYFAVPFYRNKMHIPYITPFHLVTDEPPPKTIGDAARLNLLVNTLEPLAFTSQASHGLDELNSALDDTYQESEASQSLFAEFIAWEEGNQTWWK